MRRVIIIITVIFSSLLWWGVYMADNSNKESTVYFFQDVQRDVLRVASSSLNNWLVNHVQNNPTLDLSKLPQDYFREQRSPISPTTYGDVFIFQNGSPIFDNYRMFLDKYPGQNIKDFIEVQSETAGADHYYQLVDEINKNSEGQGYWTWDAERRGVEWAVWMPMSFEGQDFVLLITTPQQIIFDVASVSQNKLYYMFIASIANILLILVFIFFYYWQEKKIRDALSESGNVTKIGELQHDLETCKLKLENQSNQYQKVSEELESAMNMMIDKDMKINEVQNKLKDRMNG
ncbi:MAG: hypothetical protein AUJ28_02075 [Parcubacteria group bacterium CG1_02_37_51]|uniref:Uncharacterized protein n=2 Tax=Candidatus Komeiliibacteriota TaxID=1817908 RepID=A0A2M8DSF9_9BACT|nr:MAG: hypothetical protein AUJ28_02075 [Parcubacteria group bacterium CG1_02_37_51]PIY95311.1 MAG: hypothetical protein COY67_00450 [Candidatus Komeilibacteria bacterium CG_4_10_14_0_8_um_filter_37_78]PJC02318.1 MAG: hypothetical protein CO073_00105 [Candidatus Komeilibacteria bacterium CG_4_9_14_0_8_um_filter_36_9]